MVLQQLDIQKQRELILDIDFTTFKKTNSKWITDFNVKCETIKLLEDNIEENADDLGFGDNAFQIQYQRHDP